jgi:hypothetical protein
MNEERKALNRYLTTMETKLKALFGERYTQVMKLHTVRQAIEGGAEFEWRNNVRAQKDALRTLKALSSDTKDLIENGITYAYGKGEKRAEKDVLNAVGGDGETQEQARKVCEEATKERRRDGKDAAHLIRDNERLTRRVWNLQGESLKEIEIIIQNGMMEGKSADEMARECEKYLNEPQKLFRRVWNEKTGEYELSKAARNYHPGTGVYRSSYKNALRMVRTEVNNAYRDAEWQSYQNNPLVKKYRINLSSNHTTTTTEGDIVVIHDICDELAGVYPKSFKWHGWHPQCRCYMTPITMTPSEFGGYLKGKREGRKEEDEELPKEFKDWAEKNKERIEKAKEKGSEADFIKDNEGVENGELEKPFFEFPKDKQFFSKEFMDEFDALEDLDEVLRIAEEDFGFHKEITKRWKTRCTRKNSRVDVSDIKDWVRDYLIKEERPFFSIKSRQSSYDYVKDKLSDKDVLKSLKAAPKEWSDELRKTLTSLCSRDCINQSEVEYCRNIIDLATSKRAKEYGLDKISTKMPAQIVNDKFFDGWYKNEKTAEWSIPSKAFFDKLKMFTPLKVEGADEINDEGFCSWTFNYVYIEGGRFSQAAKRDRLEVIYHEYGHALDAQYEINPTMWKKGIGKDFKEQYDILKGKYRDDEELYSYMSYFKEGTKLRIVTDKMEKATETLRGKNDYSEEEANTLNDILCGINDGYRFYGHSREYFKQKGYPLCEFIAECFETYWRGGNLMIKEFDPQMHEAMEKLVKDFYGINTK